MTEREPHLLSFPPDFVEQLDCMELSSTPTCVNQASLQPSQSKKVIRFADARPLTVQRRSPSDEHSHCSEQSSYSFLSQGSLSMLSSASSLESPLVTPTTETAASLTHTHMPTSIASPFVKPNTSQNMLGTVGGGRNRHRRGRALDQSVLQNVMAGMDPDEVTNLMNETV